MGFPRVEGGGSGGATQANQPKNWLEQAGDAIKSVGANKAQTAGQTGVNSKTVDNKKGFDPGKWLGDLATVGLPESIVVTTDKLRLPANIKSFALLNPVTLKGTHFINHPQTAKVIGGVEFTHVEATQYTLDGKGTRREDGIGYTTQYGNPQNPSTFFANVRGGDSNLHNAANGVSVNVGFFGPVAGVKPVLEKVLSNSKTQGLKRGLIRGLDAATAAGGQAGFAWSGTLLRDSKTKQWTLNIGGVKMPLGDLAKAPKGSVGASVNYAKKPIARGNNEEAYTRGANPFARADETRSASGAYLNHTDPVASIAGDVRALQLRVEGKDASPVRSNKHAARVLSLAIGLSKSMTPQEARKWRQVEDVKNQSIHRDALSPKERVKLDETLSKLDKADMYFGSDAVKAAAQEASRASGMASRAKGGNAEQTFVRDVFAGKFRGQARRQYSFGDVVRDLALGLNRLAAPVSTLFSDDGTMAPDNGNPDLGLRRKAKGFTDRVAKDGGALQQLGVKAPATMNAKAAEDKASAALSEAVRHRVVFYSKLPDTAENRYQAFKAMSPAEKRAVAARVQAELNRR